MTPFALVVAFLTVALLVIIGLGVRAIFQDVRFMATIVERNISDAQDQAAELEARDDRPADNATKPLGFGVRLHERS